MKPFRDRGFLSFKYRDAHHDCPSPRLSQPCIPRREWTKVTIRGRPTRRTTVLFSRTRSTPTLNRAGRSTNTCAAPHPTMHLSTALLLRSLPSTQFRTIPLVFSLSEVIGTSFRRYDRSFDVPTPSDGNIVGTQPARWWAYPNRNLLSPTPGYFSP